MCKGPEPLVQLRNCALVFSSPDRVYPWSVASLKALGTGASLEQVLRKRRPSFYTATLISNMKTVKGRGPAAGQWLQVYPFGLGKTTAWSLLLLLGGLLPRPCPGTPPTPAARVAVCWAPESQGENSSQSHGTVIACAPGQGACSVLVLCPLRAMWPHSLQLLRDLRPVTPSQASLYSSLE